MKIVDVVLTVVCFAIVFALSHNIIVAAVAAFVFYKSMVEAERKRMNKEPQNVANEVR